MAYAFVENQKVYVGDTVSFKMDVEQCGTVAKIKRDGFGRTLLVLEKDSGFIGEYIGGQTSVEVDARDCWID